MPESDSTITSISIHRGKAQLGQDLHDQLVLLATSDDPRMPSSRHVLDDVDVVRFGRGPREIQRHVDGGQRVLTLRIPDRRVSSNHGSMRRAQGSWLLDDPSSRNGIVVNGTLTRRTMLGDGAVVELGHTFFLLRIGPLEKDAPPDIDETALRAPIQILATFEGGLAERFAALARVAQSNVAILLLGETGTGKEVVARALHALSGRRGTFVGVNCGALPTTLVEGELFGHKRGAYTGALTDRPGLVRSAEAGTLLLDEIGELPLASQAALLRVIADRTVTPVGDDRPVPVDVRLCAATLRDLSALVETGEFRPDLYARLVGFKLRLPALRDRRADLGLLLRARLAEAPGGDRVTFTPAALRALFRYEWPLNIRELDSVVQRAVALSPDGVIDINHLELQPSMAPALRGSSPDAMEALSPDANGGTRSTSPPFGATPEEPPAQPSSFAVPSSPPPTQPPTQPIHAAPPSQPAPPPQPAPFASASSASASSSGLPSQLAEDGTIRERLVELLTEHRGNVKGVARVLNRRRTQVYRWVQRFGLDLDSFRR
ncbi:MAG TPA: sigma 54-interacting transcriptional regulator [Kofleriaceae bacterium]|nr:sigma 54-interacting transcriptional regulator [Kofleriaceae bacterium]